MMLCDTVNMEATFSAAFMDKTKTNVRLCLLQIIK